MKFTPDTSNFSAGYITEDGEYTFKIYGTKEVVGQKGEGLAIQLACVDTGNTMRETIWNTKGAKHRATRLAIAMGTRIKQGEDVEIGDADIGNQFKCTVKMGEPKNGVSYAEIARFDDGPHGYLYYKDGDEPEQPTPAAPAPDKAIEDEGGDEW